MSDNSTGATDNGIDTVEPSMEDILASIRRIIADDEVQKPEVSEVASEVQQDTNLPPELPQASADITPPVTQADTPMILNRLLFQILASIRYQTYYLHKKRHQLIMLLMAYLMIILQNRVWK